MDSSALVRYHSVGQKDRMTQSPTLLVLAAGIGSRYGGLKQMEPIGPSGEAIVDYSIYDALQAGFQRVVFVLRHAMAQDFRQLVGSRFEPHIEVSYVYQELDKIPARFSVPPGRTKPWGTAHAVLCAREAIEETGCPFVTINADDFYGAEGFHLLAQHLTAGSHDYAMAGFTLRNTLSEFGPVARGICQVGADGYLQEVIERTGIEPYGNGARDHAAGLLTGDETVSMNMWAFTPAIFSQIATQFDHFLEEHGSMLDKECYLPHVVNTLIQPEEIAPEMTVQASRVQVLPTRETWFGVTYRDDLPRVTAGIRTLIQQGRYPEDLWAQSVSREPRA
jgi:NDP-sugar pyrophosphorylase family protein